MKKAGKKVAKKAGKKDSFKCCVNCWRLGLASHCLLGQKVICNGQTQKH